MDRRAFLAASAVTATIARTKTSAADTLPLGPLPNSRYSDTHIGSRWQPARPPRHWLWSAFGMSL